MRVGALEPFAAGVDQQTMGSTVDRADLHIPRVRGGDLRFHSFYDRAYSCTFHGET